MESRRRRGKRRANEELNMDRQDGRDKKGKGEK